LAGAIDFSFNHVVKTYFRQGLARFETIAGVELRRRRKKKKKVATGSRTRVRMFLRQLTTRNRDNDQSEAAR
jgi:hypothetical protein